MRRKLKIAVALAALCFLAVSNCLAANHGKVITDSVFSKTVNEKINYNIYIPFGYEQSDARYPLILLLHGRGNNKDAWLKMQTDFDELIETGAVKPFIAVMPDAPWSERGSYYVDSGYKTGKRVETALIRDFLPAVDKKYRTLTVRENRYVCGYSMGGYGAVRYLLKYPEIFSGGIVLSPAVYYPLPPKDSSTREFGAFGKEEFLFEDDIWLAKNYPDTLASFEKSGYKSKAYIAVGDDEYKLPGVDERMHDLDMEAHMLFNFAVRTKNLAVEFRCLQGGHGWAVWRPGFIEGAKLMLSTKEQTK